MQTTNPEMHLRAKGNGRVSVLAKDRDPKTTMACCPTLSATAHDNGLPVPYRAKPSPAETRQEPCIRSCSRRAGGIQWSINVEGVDF